MTEDLDFRVARTNEDQLAAWDGAEGAYWADHADEYDRAVSVHHLALLDAAAVRPADRVLDIGCGTGQTTRDLARAAREGAALGVDLSSRMLEVARRRAAAEGVGNATFVQADAQIHPFEDSAFDLAFSRTGAMFFGDQREAFANIARALRPGGRIALLAWQPMAENEWIREFSTAMAAGRDMSPPPAGAPGPFALADPEHVLRVLGSAGFAEIHLVSLRGDMWFGPDAAAAHQFVLGQLGWMLEGVDEATRSRALEALSALMRAHEKPGGVLFGSAAWVVRAVRT